MSAGAADLHFSTRKRDGISEKVSIISVLFLLGYLGRYLNRIGALAFYALLSRSGPPSMSSGLNTRFPSTFLTTSSTRLSRNASSLAACQSKHSHICRSGTGGQHLLSDQGHGIVLSVPVRVAADLDALGLNAGCEVGQVAGDLAFGIGCLDNDSVASLAFRIDESGDDVRLDAV